MTPPAGPTGPHNLPGTDNGPNGIGMPPSSATQGKGKGKGKRTPNGGHIPVPPVPPPYVPQAYGALPLGQCTTSAQRNTEGRAFRSYLAQWGIQPPLDARGRMLPRSRWYLTQTGQVALGKPPVGAEPPPDPELVPREPLAPVPYVAPKRINIPGMPAATQAKLDDLAERMAADEANDQLHVLDHMEMERQVQVVVKLIGRGATQNEITQYARANWRTGYTATALAHTMTQAKAVIRSNWAVDREQFLCDLLEQYASLHAEARRQGNLPVALGVLNSVARLAMVGGFNPRAVAAA